MAHTNHTQRLARTEEALTVLFCLIDDAYRLLNLSGRRYESLKRLSDSEVITLALLQQLRRVESERSFLRDAQGFFSHLFPGVVGLHPSSLHRRVRKARALLGAPASGDPLRVGGRSLKTLLIDSTLLAALHPRQVARSAGFPGAAWVRWGSFSVYGVKLHVLCATDGVPISYELAPFRTWRRSCSPRRTWETISSAGSSGTSPTEASGHALAEGGISLVSERTDQHGQTQRIEIALSSLKRAFGLDGTLATTLVGLASRIAAKMICAYTYGFQVDRLLGRAQGRIKEPWA